MITKHELSEKMEYSACRECGTKKKSESPTGIEPMTLRTQVGRSTTELLGDSWRT